MIRVLLSGGLDSMVCLAWAMRQRGPVEAIGFDYCQPHVRELECARRIADVCRVPFRRVDAGGLVGGLLEGGRADGDAVVPGRNRRFLEIAANLAPLPDALVIGANLDDVEHFEDCRPEVIQSIAADLRVTIHQPLAEMTKARVVEFMAELGASSLLTYTWTCYGPGPTPCFRCSACKTRALAFPCLFCGATAGGRCFHPNHGYVGLHSARRRFSSGDSLACHCTPPEARYDPARDSVDCIGCGGWVPQR